jgi:hypothetical protein
MYFDAYGPFYVVARNRKIKKAEQHKFWEQVRNKSKQNDYENTELERSFGVYVFGIQWGDILTPWYVGQTLAANGFRGEIFQYHKLKTYNRVIRDNSGKPIIFLFPLLTPKQWFSESRSDFNRRLVDWVEKMLFGLTFSKNSECSNEHGMKFLRECVVNGVMGPPCPAVL